MEKGGHCIWNIYQDKICAKQQNKSQEMAKDQNHEDHIL